MKKILDLAQRQRIWSLLAENVIEKNNNEEY